VNITIGYWETRDGRKARVLCTDAPSSYPVVGYIMYEHGCSCSNWTSSGSFSNSMGQNDLIRPWVDRPLVDWSREREWVKAVAMDDTGFCYRFDVVPAPSGRIWSIQSGGFCSKMHPSEYPQFTGNWKDSLCVRPEVEGGSK
jgi:hypothetical protein